MAGSDRVHVSTSDQIGDISTGTLEGHGRVVPFDCELMEFIFQPDKTIATGGGGDPHTFDILIDGVDSGIDIGIPEGALLDVGLVVPLPQTIFLAAGQKLNIESNDEQVTSSTFVSWAIRARQTSNTFSNSVNWIPNVERLNLFQLPSTTRGIVVPERSEVVGAWFNPSVAIATAAGAGTLQLVEVNDVTTSQGLLMPEGLAANTGVYGHCPSPVLVQKGDKLTLLSDEEQILTGNYQFTWGLRPLRNSRLVSMPVLRMPDAAMVDDECGRAVVSQNCLLEGIVCHFDAAPDVLTTFDIMVDNADTTFDCAHPVGAVSADLELLGDQIYLKAGQTIHLKSNGQTTVASEANFTFIFKPTESPSS